MARLGSLTIATTTTTTTQQHQCTASTEATRLCLTTRGLTRRSQSFIKTERAVAPQVRTRSEERKNA